MTVYLTLGRASSACSIVLKPVYDHQLGQHLFFVRSKDKKGGCWYLMKLAVIIPSRLILRYFHLPASPSLPFASSAWKSHIPPSVAVALKYCSTTEVLLSQYECIRWTQPRTISFVLVYRGLLILHWFLSLDVLHRSPKEEALLLFQRGSAVHFQGMPGAVPCGCFAGGCEKPRMSRGDGRGIIRPKPQEEEASLLVSQALLSSTDLARCEWGNNYSNAHPNGQWCGEELIAFEPCGHVEVRTGPVLADQRTFCSCQQSGSGRETLGVRGQS